MQFSRLAHGTARASPPRVLSFSHEILVDLCRQRGDLARALLHLLGIVPGGARAELGSIDLSQVVPTEYRADAVTVFRDQEVARAAAIIEVQLQYDPDKRRSWPVYVAALRAALGCPVYLLVIAPDPSVARRVGAPIELGHPGFALTPLVIGFEDLPRVIDADVARRLPELAVLSTLAHPEFEVARTAIGAIRELPEDRARLYLDLIIAAVPDAVRRSLEALTMKGYEYQSEFARKYYGQGVEVGRAEGLRDAVLELARARLADLSSDETAAVRALGDETMLHALIGALARATTAEEARTLLRGVAAER